MGRAVAYTQNLEGFFLKSMNATTAAHKGVVAIATTEPTATPTSATE